MFDNRTANLEYLLPDPRNRMKSEDLPRLIETLNMIDADIAQILVAMLGFAPKVHSHEMAEVNGLISALSGKAAQIHNHSIGSLTGVDFTNAAAGQFPRFSGSLWIPAFISAADLAAKIITDAHLRDSNGVSVLGRSVATPGRPADISALTNDRLLARVGDALAFVQMTIGMVPDNLLTFAKLATAALASQAEAEAGAVSNKLMTPLQTKQAINANAPAFSLPTMIVRHELAANTSGGNTVSGAWNTRPLNTTVVNTISGASLSSNRVTLPAGRYAITATSAVSNGAYNKLRLRNITSGTTLCAGMSMRISGGNLDTLNTLINEITIGSPIVVELQHYTSFGVATIGLGEPVNASEVEVYAEMRIEKLP